MRGEQFLQTCSDAVDRARRARLVKILSRT
jgi:hypothetical protein